MDKRIQNLQNIDTYINRLLDENQLTDLTDREIVDILGSMDDISKRIKEYVDDQKKKLDFEKEIRGAKYKLKKAITPNYEIPPATLAEELSEGDFLKCCKIVTQRVTAFLSNQRIEQLKTKVGETERYHFETIS